MINHKQQNKRYEVSRYVKVGVSFETRSVNQPISQSINQSINKSVNQSINQSTTLLMCQVDLAYIYENKVGTPNYQLIKS